MNGRLYIPLFVVLFFVLFSTGCTNNGSNTDHVNPADDSHISDTPEYPEDSQETVDNGSGLDGDLPPLGPEHPFDDDPDLSENQPDEPPASNETPPVPEDYSGDDGGYSDGSMPKDKRCVDLAATNEITLYWEQPSQNVDGTPLLNLAGYRVFYGKHSGNLTYMMDVGSNTNPTILNLDPGMWYFSVKVYNTQGVESNFSNETCAVL